MATMKRVKPSMARVCFGDHFTKHVPACDMKVDASTVAEALSAAFDQFPILRGYVLDDAGRVRQHVMVFVDDRFLTDRARQQDPISPTSEIFVMQALSGG